MPFWGTERFYTLTVGGWHFPVGEVMLMWQDRMLRIVWILICIMLTLYICTIKAR